MRKRYLFFDIDGTLIAGGYETGFIPESAKEALRRLREQGHFLAIATGRSNAMAKEIMRMAGIENMVSDGGYGITLNNILLGIKPLPKDQICELIRECDERGFPWGLQTDDSDTRLAPDERFYEATHDTYLKTRVVTGLRPENSEIIYKAYVACAPPLEDTLRSLEPLPRARYHKEYFFVEPTYKDEGIRAVMDHLKAPYRDAIVFGDSYNDLSMFTDEWTKVAMGNAVQELKERADYVTTDVDRDGIYNACAALGLI